MPCPKCAHPNNETDTACERCGVVFHKYQAYLEARERLDRERTRLVWRQRLRQLWKALLEPHSSLAQYRGGYALLWAAFVVWGLVHISAGIDELGRGGWFMHQVNLPFHEAGHVIFGLFGDFIGSLGGTLGQLMIPVICGTALLTTRADTFGASLCLWWFGENFLDIAPYMADARAGELLLLGGNYGHSSPYGFHDWEFILGETGLLAHDQTLAAITLNLGRLIMLAAMLWGGYLLCRAGRRRESDL